MRTEVASFVAMGPLPDWDASEEQISHRQAQLEAILPPVTDEEAAALTECFGPDDCYGLAWSLVHLIETSPTPAITTQPRSNANEWRYTLWQRAVNGGLIAENDI